MLIFPASVKLVPRCAGHLGTQLGLIRFGRYKSQDFYLKDFVLQVSVMKNETIMVFK